MLTTLPAMLVVSLAIVIAACSPGDSLPSPSASDPLLTITTRGGLCREGACESVVVLERDGRVHQAAKPPNNLGTVAPDKLAALDSAIRATDFAALKSHPFTGTCPTAYDGQEVVLEFDTPGGVQRIASCEVDVDFGQPLFVAVSSALGPIIPFLNACRGECQTNAQP